MIFKEKGSPQEKDLSPQDTLELLEVEMGELRRREQSARSRLNQAQQRYKKDRGSLRIKLYKFLDSHGFYGTAGLVFPLSRLRGDHDDLSRSYALKLKEYGRANSKLFREKLQKDPLKEDRDDSGDEKDEVFVVDDLNDSQLIVNKKGKDFKEADTEDVEAPHWSEWSDWGKSREVADAEWMLPDSHRFIIHQGVIKEPKEISTFEELEEVVGDIKGLANITPEDILRRLIKISGTDPKDLGSTFKEKVAGGPFAGWYKYPIGRKWRLIFSLQDDVVNFRLGDHSDVYGTRRRNPRDRTRSL